MFTLDDFVGANIVFTREIALVQDPYFPSGKTPVTVVLTWNVDRKSLFLHFTSNPHVWLKFMPIVDLYLHEWVKFYSPAPAGMPSESITLSFSRSFKNDLGTGLEYINDLIFVLRQIYNGELTNSKTNIQQAEVSPQNSSTYGGGNEGNYRNEIELTREG